VIDDCFEVMHVRQRQGGGLASAEPPFQDGGRNVRYGPDGQRGCVLDGLRGDVVVASPQNLVRHRLWHPDCLSKTLEQFEMPAASKEDQR